jgi:hypothetical protein
MELSSIKDISHHVNWRDIEFWFEDQLSNLAISDIEFQVLPIPGAVLLFSSVTGLHLRKTRVYI